MLKLLIADDELYVREYMKTILDWNSLGICVCGCAEDGPEAIEVAENTKPDMAFLDINMPGLDGLTLTETLKEKFPDLVIAFVTGYSEFEYARKALQLGAEEYLLKPFSPEELGTAVQRMLLKIKKRREERHESRSDRLVLRENVIHQLLNSGDMNLYESRKKHMETLGIQFPYSDFLAVQMEIQMRENVSEEDWGLWKFSIRNIKEEYPSIPKTCFYMVNEEGKKLGIVLNGEEKSLEKETLQDYFSEIKEIIWNYLNLLVTIGIGERRTEPERLSNSYNEAKSACQEQQLGGYGKIYFYGESQKFRSRRADEIIDAVEKEIQKHYQEYDLTVEKIAENVYLDSSYIRRIFSKYKGRTIVDYLTDYRMKEARKLLEKGGIPVGRVAEMVGYTDQGYFSKCFKKYYGMTPSRCPVLSKS